MSHSQFEQIGVIRLPHKEKFAAPCQPGLVKSASGELHLLAPYNQANAVRGLGVFSHLWAVFVSYQTMEGGWRPTVRPPRLGGNARMGVFVTRPMFRPSLVGMSLVELRGIRCHKEYVVLELGGLDLVDGMPVADIKPYPPFAESLPDARTNHAQDVLKASTDVTLSEDPAEQLPKLEQRYPYLRQLIAEVLAQGPRPVYRKDEEEGKTYAVWLLDFNVRWRVMPSGFEVFVLEARQFASRTLSTSLPRW